MDAANIFFKAHDLKKKLLFTLVILFVCRVGSYITIPGINSFALSSLAAANSKGILGMFNVFSGGSLSRMSIFALSIVPYITSSIVMSLLTVAVKPLEDLKKEGEVGRRKINQYTRYLTVILCAFQAYGLARGLENMRGAGENIVIISSGLFRVTTVITLVVGTMFLMWLGEQISMRGIGNGTSLIIFTGIISGLPATFASILELTKTGVMGPFTLIFIFLVVVALIYFIVFMERAQRKIPVQYPKRQMGNKLFEGQSTHLPLKINTAGVIPAIFANSILLFPLTITNFMSGNEGEGGFWNTVLIYLGRGKPLYLILYVLFIVFFAFFYTSIVFNAQETATMLKKNGGFIPGIRPGEYTAKYLDKILARLTVIGAAYLSFVCVLPEYVSSKYAIPFYLGGTSFLIVVSVVLETLSQVQSSLFSYQYESLMKKARFRR